MRRFLPLLCSIAFAIVVVSSVAAESAGRIVSVDAGTDTLLLKLADLGQILAVSERTRDPSVSLQWENARAVRGIRGEMAEEIYRMNPDLVFFGHWSGMASRELLNKVGVPVVRLGNPESWEEVYSNIRRVGALVGHPDRAESMVESMQQRLAAVAEKIQHESPKRAVFYVGRGTVYGARSKQNIVLESAGLINIPAELGMQGMGKMSIEELLLHRPDVIVFSDYQKDTPTISRQIMDHPAFTSLRSGHAITIDLPSNKINCLDNYLVDCVELLAHIAYPDAFGDTLAMDVVDSRPAKKEGPEAMLNRGNPQ